jgi:hypothetical protein
MIITKQKSQLAVLAIAMTLFGCGSSKHAAPAAPPRPPPADLAPRANTIATSTLPEDPVAAKRATAQWNHHLDHEEDERQMGFDRRHLREHKAVIKLLKNARAQYDGAHSESALQTVSADMPRELAQIERKLKELDPWGNNSRALPDYAALQAMLGPTYERAKRAAIRGDEKALDQVKEGFDARLEHIHDWLEKSEENEEEE